MPEKQVFQLYGFSVASDLALPELTPLALSAEEADVTVSLCPVPPSLNGADHSFPFYETKGTDELLLRFPKMGRYLVRGGTEVLIDPAPDSDLREVRAALLGSVAGALLHQRNLLPLHASAVACPAGAVLFTGASGAGKSTMAAAMSTRAGYPIIADDISVVEETGTMITVRPGIPQLKLWSDAMDALEQPQQDSQRDSFRWDKFRVPTPVSGQPHPVRALVVLEDSPDPRPTLHQLTGQAAMAALLKNVYRPEFAQRLGRGERLFTQVSTCAKRVPVYTLSRRRDFADLDSLTALLAETWSRDPVTHRQKCALS